MIQITARLLLVAMLAAPAAARGPEKPTVSASLLDPVTRSAAATVDAFHSALRRGDTKAAVAMLADDVLIFESGEVERSKAEYAAHHLAADAEYSAGTTSTVIHRSGTSAGTLAWIASDGRTVGEFSGRPIDVATTETMILRRAHGMWKIIQIHWSSAKSR